MRHSQRKYRETSGEERKSKSTARELVAPQESKDVPIPPDSDPRKRRAMKAVTAVASSCNSQNGK